jgi:hypothetical protein
MAGRRFEQFEHSKLEPRMATLKKYIVLMAVGLLLFLPCLSEASIIDTNSVWVTDVTPVQFSVVWGTSEPATGSVNVFSDADGTVPVADAVVHFESADHPPAEDIGVMKVRVTNLQPNTQYYFQTKTTSKNNGNVTLYPESPIAVTTMDESIIVQNDVLAQQISMGSGQSTQGTLVIAEVDQASYPVTGWAGDGVPDGWVAIDTNNFYDKNDHVNLELAGGEPIVLTFFCGSMGTVVTQDTVPAESGGIQQVSVKASLPSSGGGSLSSTSSSGSGGGSCFIGTAAFGSKMEYSGQTLSALLIIAFVIMGVFSACQGVRHKAQGTRQKAIIHRRER